MELSWTSIHDCNVAALIFCIGRLGLLNLIIRCIYVVGDGEVFMSRRGIIERFRYVMCDAKFSIDGQFF